MAVMEFESDGTVVHEHKRIAKTISVPQLYRMFPDDESCRAWLEQVRWGDKPACPRCGSLDDVRKPPPSKPGHHWCKACRKHFTVTMGTFMHSTKADLQHWIYAIYSVLTARKGVSALQFSKELGVQYKTAWHMLHRVREACGRGEFTLSEVVGADETHIGGKEGNKHEAKKLKQRGGKVTAKPVERVDAATLVGFIEESVKPGSTVYTDESSAYAPLPNAFNQFAHDTVTHSRGEYVRGDVHTNSIESVWAVLKRSIHGTWHHVSPKHLGRYVNEAAFRLNEGNCEVDTLDRMEALVRQMGGSRLSYRALVADNGLSAEVEAVR